VAITNEYWIMVGKSARRY